MDNRGTHFPRMVPLTISVVCAPALGGSQHVLKSHPMEARARAGARLMRVSPSDEGGVPLARRCNDGNCWVAA
jgi:hypothetical protein